MVMHHSVKSKSFFLCARQNGFIELGNDVRLESGSRFMAYSSNQILVGRSSTFNRNCQIYGDVMIGAYCVFASNIFISSRSHNYRKSFDPIQHQDRLGVTSSEVIIENDVWVGVNVFIKKGVYIAKGAVLTANSVILNDILEPFTVSNGVSIKSSLEGRRGNAIWRWVLRGGKWLNDTEVETDGNIILYLDKKKELMLHLNDCKSVQIFSEVELSNYDFLSLNRKDIGVPDGFNYKLIQIIGYAKITRLYN